MACNIFHGAPGSFKSSSAVYFEMLPELRKGRLVVTNIEGLKTKQEIETLLNEEFPESADIWRLSSQTDNGKKLWRRWFWWMPLNAFIILDEVQDIFPNDKAAYKPENYDNDGIDLLKELLPEKFYKGYLKALQDFKPKDSEIITDDTNQKILDDNGFIIYPPNMREANMRHRKFNWDIIYCTPDITQIHSLIRGVCQYAYRHYYFDSLEFIPWFNRRPRINEHNPKTNGLTLKKGDSKRWRKIPLVTFQLYKSTSTGTTTKRRGANGLKDSKLIITSAIFIIFLLFSFFYDSDEPVVSTETKKDDVLLVQKDNTEPVVSHNTTYNNAVDTSATNSLDIPYNAESMYLTGIIDSYKGGVNVPDFFFTLNIDNLEYSLTSEDLKSFGIKVRKLSSCVVMLVKGNLSRRIYCKPSKVLPYQNDNEYYATSGQQGV